MKRWILRISVCLFLGIVTTVAVAWGFVLTSDLRSNAPVEGGFGGPHLRWIVKVIDVSGRTQVETILDPNDPQGAAGWGSVLMNVPQLSQESMVPSWSRARSVAPEEAIDSDDPLDHMQTEEAAGWPLRALSCAYLDISLSARATAAAFPDIAVRNGNTIEWPGPVGTYDFHLSGVIGGLYVASLDPPTDPPEFVGEHRYDHKVLPLRPILPGFIINTLFYAAIWVALLFGFTRLKRVIRKKRGRCPMCKYDLRGDLDGGCSECGWNR